MLPSSTATQRRSGRFVVPATEQYQFGADLARSSQMIQHFMVGSSIAGIQRPSDGVLNLLMRSELMTSP